jgi:hypothetical protein
LRAHLHAERIVVSRLRDEAQRLVGHVQSLHVQLRAERAAVSRLEEEVQVYKTEAASTQQQISELKEKNSCDGDMENKAGKTHIIELALSACAHVESRTEVGLQYIRDWVGWMGDHLPCYMLHQHCPHIFSGAVVARRLVHGVRRQLPCLAWRLSYNPNNMAT